MNFVAIGYWLVWSASYEIEIGRRKHCFYINNAYICTVGLLYYLVRVIVLLLAAVIAGVGAFSLMMMPSSDEDDEDERMDEAELGYDALDLDDLDDVLSGFNGYAYLEDMEGDDLADLAAIAAIFGQNKRQRAIKYMYERIDWSRHVEKLDAINELENRFRMPLEHFEILCDALRECITVDFLRSRTLREATIRFIQR